MDIIWKAIIAGLVIAFASWLSEKRPELAGFIIAAPVTSIIALTMSQIQTQDSNNTIIFAKSIFVGVPISYLFFLPFFMPSIGKLGFWITMSFGLALLAAGYFIHQLFLQKLG